MDFLQPATWAEALEAKAAHPDAVPIAGGTDVMVGLNFGHLRPALLLDLTRVADLRDWAVADGAVRLGAGVSYARVISELGDRLPGLAMAARTVGSPQIRVRGTVGGNLGSASPAGDAHPPLLASRATALQLAEADRGLVTDDGDAEVGVGEALEVLPDVGDDVGRVFFDADVLTPVGAGVRVGGEAGGL